MQLGLAETVETLLIINVIFTLFRIHFINIKERKYTYVRLS